MQVKYVFIITMLIALAAAACVVGAAETPAAGFPVNITDDYRHTTTLTKSPERIVSLSPANTEILFALGLGGRIVGNTEFCDYPAEAKNIVHVSGFNAISYEKIAAVDPDVIFAEDIAGEEAVARLIGLGYPVIEVKNSNLSMIRRNILLIGQATGTGANATALVADIDRRIDGIRSRVAGLSEAQKPNVLLLTGYLTGLEIYPYGSGTYGDELLALAGGKNAAAAIDQYAVMNTEAIVQADPDYIVIPVDGIMCTMADFDHFRNGNETWMKDLTAVKEGKVIMVDGNLFMRPGPRTPDAGLALVNAINAAAAAPTSAPTPTPATTTTPGFGAALALAGLLGVACLFAGRKH